MGLAAVLGLVCRGGAGLGLRLNGGGREGEGRDRTAGDCMFRARSHRFSVGSMGGATSTPDARRAAMEREMARQAQFQGMTLQQMYALQNGTVE
jgi:hypothetical protein